MRWYEKLPRKLRNFAIPNLMLFISASMVFVFAIDYIKIFPVRITDWITFDRALILQGEVWRVITFLFVPSSSNLFSMFFFVMFYVGIGQSLEQYWGSSHFTLYYIIGVIGTIIGGFIVGNAVNTYLNLSLFFAYAYLFPNEEFRLFFVLPVKAKYLAIVDAIFYVISLVFYLIAREWGMIASLIISLANFFIFFGPGFFRDMRHKLRYRKARKEYKNYWK